MLNCHMHPRDCQHQGCDAIHHYQHHHLLYSIHYQCHYRHCSHRQHLQLLPLMRRAMIMVMMMMMMMTMYAAVGNLNDTRDHHRLMCPSTCSMPSTRCSSLYIITDSLNLSLNLNIIIIINNNNNRWRLSLLVIGIVCTKHSITRMKQLMLKLIHQLLW